MRPRFTIVIDMTITAILSWIWVNIFKLGILSILIFNVKAFLNTFIIEPIKGKDNHTSMDELAKYIIMLLLCWVIYTNGARDTEWAPYSDATVAALIAGVFSIAAIKPVVGIFKKKEDDQIRPLPPKNSEVKDN